MCFFICSIYEDKKLRYNKFKENSERDIYMVLTLYRNNKSFYIPTEKRSISEELETVLNEMIFDDNYEEYAINGNLIYTVVFSYNRSIEDENIWKKICKEFINLPNELTFNEIKNYIGTYSETDFKTLFESLFYTNFEDTLYKDISKMYYSVEILEEDILLLKINAQE